MHIHEEHGLAGVLGDAFMITGFVFVIMLVVEYINILTSGRFHGHLTSRKWQQYLLGMVIGIIPGCLGGFAVVSLFSHGVLSIGAVMATMIATTGDEAFVMLAMYPKTWLAMTAGLMVLGFVVGGLTDMVMKRWPGVAASCGLNFEVHHDDACECFSWERVIHQWRHCTPIRGILTVALGVFTFVIVTGGWETEEWDWVRVTLLVLAAAALFIVSTVPDHFLEHHLWEHVARRHLPRIFAWTFGALLVMFVLTQPLEGEFFREGIARPEAKWVALAVACLVGLVPQSGPHLIFVMAFAQGAIPLGVLVASSIVQDGHAMLPMLAHSRRVFIGIKLVKLVLGAVIGGALVAAGV